jgi:putative transposase
MPEHFHAIFWPTAETYSVSAVLKTLKQSVAARAIRYVRRSAPQFLDRMTDRQPNGTTAVRFWQRGGGYDRNLWSPDEIWKMIDYIHANPVRRRLCDTPELWPWSSAAELMGLRPGVLPVDRETIPPDLRGR